MASKFLFLLTLTLLALNCNIVNGEISQKKQKVISEANKLGPYVGIVAQGKSALNQLLQHQSFTPSITIDFAGRRFRFGDIAGEKVIVVVPGSALINAGITTQLLLTLFKVKGVVHYGVAGSVNPAHNIGDVIIPKVWTHTGLWNWQKFGSGADDTGSFSKEYGYLSFADYAVNVSECSNHDNLLSNIWYQPEEVFSVGGTPEKGKKVFWLTVNTTYYDISGKLESLVLENCANDICILTPPKVKRVRRGTSANFYLDNAAYSSFLTTKFKVGIFDMDSAAVALISLQQKVPFIIIKSVSDVAGSSANVENLIPLAVKNSVTVTVAFIKQLHQANIVSEPMFDDDM